MADQVITKQELIDAQKDAQTLEDVISGEPGKLVKTRLGREVYTLASVPQIDTMTREEVTEITGAKANSVDVYQKTETYTKSEIDSAVAPKADQQYVDNALTGFTNGAAKFYPTIAAAQADIANISVKEKVEVGEAQFGGIWYKATAGSTYLTKSPYDPLTQSQKYTNSILADGYIKNYSTETALKASLPTVSEMRARADDTRKIWRWNRTSAEGVTPVTGIWTDTGLSDLELASAYADSLSAKNVIKITDVVSADASKNLYNTANDTADFYITDSGSQTPGIIKSLSGTRLHKIAVKAGESYLFSAALLSDLLGLAFSADSNVTVNKSVTLATVVTVSASVKKLLVPSGMNYLFFNTKIPTRSFDVTASLIVNKFSSNFTGYGGANVADEKARSDVALLDTNTIKNSDLNGNDYKPNLAVNEVSGFYISAVGSSVYGAIAVLASATMQSFPVEPGKTYAIYSTNFINTRFTLAVSSTAGIAANKQLTPLTLADTSDANVKTFTVPAGMLYAFATTSIPSLSFDIRNVFWVNEGTKTSKFDVPNVTKIKGLEIRDPLAQQRLDALKNVSVLKGKKWIAIGDSITEKNMRANINYHDYIKADVGGMTIYNKGISGSGFHDRMNVGDTLTEQTDYITVFWGTNDFGLVRNTYPLGVFLSNDTETISGRINTCLNALITKYPLAKIAIISSLPRLTNYGSNAAPNSVGYTLKQHVDLLKQYAAHYSLPFLNLYEQSNLPVWIPAANEYYFTAPGLTTPDGLHPNDAGQRVMADKIKAFLESI